MIGRTLSHFRILDRIGEGGMGVVYRAEDAKLQRTVALKILPPERLADEERRLRFLREGLALAALLGVLKDWDFACGDDEAHRALALASGNADVVMEAWRFARTMGRWEEA